MYSQGPPAEPARGKDKGCLGRQLTRSLVQELTLPLYSKAQCFRIKPLASCTDVPAWYS